MVNARPPLAGRWIQLLCFTLFGLIVPFLIWLATRITSFDEGYLIVTAMAVATAGTASWYILDRLRIYAKARQLSYVVPVNAFTFGLAFGIIGILRAPYSISLFLSCFAATLGTSYVLTALNRVGNRPQYLVEGGRVSQIQKRDSHVWLDSPEMLDALLSNRDGQGSIVGDLHHDHSPEWERMFAKAALLGVPVYHYRQILELETGQVRIDHLSENVLGSLIPNLPYMALKRTIDVVGTLTLLPFMIPPMLIIALVIKLDSKGPFLFTQQRVGFRGEVFKMVKFRTMTDRVVEDTTDAKREDSMTKSDDLRITRVGRYLRKVRLDELPQIWNILRGDMSWIGPRPEAISLSEWYENEIPFYSYRHIVRPGITGWAQVNQGHVTNLNDVTAKLRYDFYYVKNISHWLDMLIALKTVRVIIRGFGAK